MISAFETVLEGDFKMPEIKCEMAPESASDWGKKLLQAVKDRDISTVREAARNGGSNWSDWQGMSAAHIAAMNGDLSLIKAMKPGPSSLQMRNKVGRPALHYACFYGRDSVVDYLLNQIGVDVNATDILNNTALHWAVKNKHKKIVHMLLEANATVDVRNKFRQTPKALAVLSEQSDILVELDTKKKQQEQQKLMGELKLSTNSIICDAQNTLNFFENFEIAGPLLSNQLSDLKDNPNSSKQLIESAEQVGRQVVLSEAGRMAMRMNMSNQTKNTEKLQQAHRSMALSSTPSRSDGVKSPSPIKSNNVRVIKLTAPKEKIIPKIADNKSGYFLRTVRSTGPFLNQATKYHKICSIRKGSGLFEVPREYDSELMQSGDFKTAHTKTISFPRPNSGNKLCGIKHLVPPHKRSTIKPITVHDMHRQLAELRRSNEELRQIADAANKDRDELRKRLDRLESLILQNQQDPQA